MFRISPNFILPELTKSATANRAGIDNTPNEDEILNLSILVINVLQPIRDHYNKSVVVSSGFRSKQLNILLNGAGTSQHMQGKAADIEIYGVDNFLLANWIKDNLEFDQLVLEFYTGETSSGWVHVSFNSGNNRKEVLTVSKGSIAKGLNS